MTASPLTHYTATGTNGTLTLPWPGDTYTILSTTTWDIVGWVVYHSGTWRAVSLSGGGDLQGAYRLLDAIPVSIRRDGHASFYDAWGAVEGSQ